jgi:DNA-binding transcriptional regulator YbjK
MQEKILNAAFALAAKKGLRNIRRAQIAKRAQCAAGLVSYYFRPDGMDGLRTAIVKRAIEREHLGILASALAEQHAAAKAAPSELKQKALATLAA